MSDTSVIIPRTECTPKEPLPENIADDLLIKVLSSAADESGYIWCHAAVTSLCADIEATFRSRSPNEFSAAVMISLIRSFYSILEAHNIQTPPACLKHRNSGHAQLLSRLASYFGLCFPA